MTVATAAAAFAPGFTSEGRRRRTRRYWGVTSVLALLVLVAATLGMMVGDVWYAPSDVLAVLLGKQVPGASFVVGQLRAPRVCLGILCGVAFGVAGRACQTMLRNQLASPDIIGITSGASTAAVFSILVLGISGPLLTLIAVAAGLATAMVIVVLSGKGKAQGGRLILIGIGISSMLVSVTAYLQLKANIYDVADAMRWVSGSLSGIQWDRAPVLVVADIVCLTALAFLASTLRVMPLGEEAATALGVHSNRARTVMLLLIVGLSACATATSGPIAFVSFLAGPITAKLVGSTDRSLLLPCALTGALIVLVADLAGQYLFPTALPVGVVTGIVGAPYLLFQLIRLNRQGASS